jgi:hypothetical protein
MRPRCPATCSGLARLQWEKAFGGNNDHAAQDAWLVKLAMDSTNLPAPTGLIKISPDNNPLPALKWDVVPGAASYDTKIDAGSWMNNGNKLTCVQPTLLSKGSHTFSVRAIDEFGVTSSTASIDFNVSTTSDLTNTKMVFYSYRDGGPTIYISNADFTGVARLTFGPEETAPAWSPDGTKIAFISYRDDSFNIYVMNADGSD